MSIDFKKISPYEERLRNFEDSDIICRIDKAKASVLSPKAKDCQRQLNEASSVWAIDGLRFLVVFSNESDAEGRQKATVWGRKSPGDYQRIKTVWVSIRDYVFEAVALFLMEYFELFILTATYSSDVRMLQDIEHKLNESARYTPSHLKQKIKLLKAWTEIMPRFNRLVTDLDKKISVEAERNVYESVEFGRSKAKPRMKAFFPTKAAPYYFNEIYTVAVRKECIEFYQKLRKGHAMANVEVFSNTVRISVVCGEFVDELFGKVVQERIGVEEHPKLIELLDNGCRYNLLTDKSGAQPVSSIFLEIDREFDNWMVAIADKEVNKEIQELMSFCLDLYNELVKSPKSSIKALSRHFYD